MSQTLAALAVAATALAACAGQSTVAEVLPARHIPVVGRSCEPCNCVQDGGLVVRPTSLDEIFPHIVLGRISVAQLIERLNRVGRCDISAPTLGEAHGSCQGWRVPTNDEVARLTGHGRGVAHGLYFSTNVDPPAIVGRRIASGRLHGAGGQFLLVRRAGAYALASVSGEEGKKAELDCDCVHSSLEAQSECVIRSRMYEERRYFRGCYR